MILLRPLSGLCNRLRAIKSAIKLSSEAHCQCICFWQTDPYMNAQFRDLLYPIAGLPVFDVGCDNLLKRVIFHRWNCLSYRGKEWPVRNDAIQCASSIRPWAISTCYEFWPGGDYSWLRPRQEIIEMVKTINIDNSVIGIHIRRTDNEMSCKYSPLEMFISRIRTELEMFPDSLFFLATDDEETKTVLDREFGSAIITRDSVTSRNDEGGVQDAFVDLLLLSRCKKIIGSYWSSFSVTASQISGIPLEIVSTIKNTPV